VRTGSLSESPQAAGPETHGINISSEHTAQCLNYLRASGRSVCLLVNFQKPKVEWKRIVHRFGVSEPLKTPTVPR
jgi:hypothetical protein